MDGNGRWAQSRGHSRFFGHVKGAKVARSTIETAKNLGVKYLTLFTFSTENWFRPEQEVNFLMRLLRKHLIRERKMLLSNNIRFLCIGNIHRLPSMAREELEKTMSLTSQNTGMVLTFALSYGGRQEILEAVRKIAEGVKRGDIDPAKIDEDLVRSHMGSHLLPDPDMIIRTSGEHRLSNFFLWQSAYSELFITPKLWPDFSPDDLKECILNFQKRDRRFGRVDSKPNPQPNL